MPEAEQTAAKSAPVMNTRGAVRFPLQLSVKVHQENADTQAETKDISAGGVLLQCDNKYPVGATIQFSIAMPARSMGADKDVLVDCVGRVVRCSPEGNKVAVGAVIDEYRITR